MAYTDKKQKTSKKRKLQNAVDLKATQNIQAVGEVGTEIYSLQKKVKTQKEVEQEGGESESKKKVKKRGKRANIDLEKKLKASGIIKKKTKQQPSENTIIVTETKEVLEDVNTATFGRKERKELLKLRKSKKNQHYVLLQGLAKSWEVLRQSDTPKEKRAQIVQKIMSKVKGQISQLCRNHVGSRIMQSLIKFGSPEDLQIIISDIKEDIKELSKDVFAHHVVKKIIAAEQASRVEGLVRLFLGSVTQLLRHPCGCVVIDDLYLVASSDSKNQMLAEFYGKEYRLFGSSIMPSTDEHKNNNKYATFESIWSQAPEAERKNIIRNLGASMTSVIDRELLDAQMTHRLLSIYIEHASASLVEEAVQNLSGEQLLRMVHTREGAKTACMVVGYASVKDRKKIVKALKGHVLNMAKDSFGHNVLITILHKIDDTTVLNKIVIQELVDNLQEMCQDKFASRVLLHLLSPYNRRHVPQFVIKEILTFPSKKLIKTVQTGEESEDQVEVNDQMDIDEQTEEIILGLSKKDDLVRRTELLQDSKTNLLQKMFDLCIEKPKYMLTTRYCDYFIQELCIGGKDGFLVDLSNDQIDKLHDAICQIVDAETMDEFFGNRSLGYMVSQDGADGTQKGASRSFAKKMWQNCIQTNCQKYFTRHAQKVFAGLCVCGDVKVQKEVQKKLERLLQGNFDEWLAKFRPAV